MTKFISVLPSWVVFLAIMGPFALGMYLPIRMMFIAVIPWYLWIYSLGVTAHSALPESTRMSLAKFKYALAFSAGYTIVASLYFYSIMPYAIPFHLLSMFCIFYSFYFVAKSIRSVELNRATQARDWSEIFIGLWFFPVGTWFIQPKIQRLVKGSDITFTTKMSPPRPFLVSIGMVFAALNAFVALVVMPYIVITQDYIISNGEQVSTRYFAQRELPVDLFFGLLFLVIFLTFLRGNKWSRHLIMFFWSVIWVWSLTTLKSAQEKISFTLALSIPLLFSIWYFYFKSNVISYYKELQRQTKH